MGSRPACAVLCSGLHGRNSCVVCVCVCVCTRSLSTLRPHTPALDPTAESDSPPCPQQRLRRPAEGWPSRAQLQQTQGGLCRYHPPPSPPSLSLPLMSKPPLSAAGLDGTLSSRATAAAAGLQIPSSTAGGGGGTARVAGRPYQLGGPGPSAPSGGGPQAPAGGHAKPPLSKEQANPAFARRVVPAAGAAGLQPHPPDAGPRVGSGGPQASGQSGAQGSSGTAARDPLPDRNKQEIMQPLTARATGTGKWEDGVNGPAAKQPLTSRPVGKDEVQVKPTR